MEDNTQHKLDQVRPPRVQITYDVMVGNAMEHKELPFVVGIMADLSGMRDDEPIPLKDRSFVGIYSENMNDIMAHIDPKLNLSVENKLLNNNKKINVNLKFECMEDFSPINLIKQIPALFALYESRINLQDLLSKMDGNDALEEMLMEIMQDPDKQEKLLKEIEAELGMAPGKRKTKDDPSLEDIKQTLNELPPVAIDEHPLADLNFNSVYEAPLGSFGVKINSEQDVQNKPSESKKDDHDDFF